MRADWASLFQKDPALFDPSETPEAKPESERAAFIEELKAGSRLALALHLLPCTCPAPLAAAWCCARRFYGGARYENSRSEEEKAAFRCALHETMDLWCAAPRV